MRTKLSIIMAMLATLLCIPGQAQAASPAKWGFAYVDNPTAAVWTTLDPTHQWGSWKTAAPALSAEGRLVGGVYQVKFPAIGTGTRGLAHVTAVGGTGNYCHLVRWFQEGVDEIVEVKCQMARSVSPSPTRFTVLWTLSPGVTGGQGAHAYLHLATGERYNSTGGPVTVTGSNPYLVQFAGVGALTGNIQVTAVGQAQQALRCKVMDWKYTVAVSASVYCFTASGQAPPGVDFTASYHRERSIIGAAPPEPPKAYGHLWCFNGSAGARYPVNVGCGQTGPAKYLTSFPGQQLNETHAQVTAYGPGPGVTAPGDPATYCTLTTIWVNAQPPVNCFTSTGAPSLNSFFTAFTTSRP
ncbi:hypothetical protein SAMN05421504_10459 [Amycolatopsis xylanica]|uniref:Uncharacterized protein n=1 Tax=Amycolatopsis xylanica TaxID=589385 RepID=A0A1H3FZK9_9PSEU|nr:hypothetical protein [Amycolatopsis xylanica]SDX96340.1 hypothetical protein SAMN05421504_10459 [Amycolatopsis xylanica]